MKKIIVLVTVIFIAFSSALAQEHTIKGFVYDEVTKEPIPFLAVGTIDYESGTTTNIEGEFILRTKTKENSFLISHLNYESKTLTVSTEEGHVYYVKRKENLLDEVIIVSEPIQKILIEYIEKSRLAMTKPIALNVYAREFVKADGEYVKFSDGLLKYYFSNKKTKLEVLDSRAIELKKIAAEIDSTDELNMDLNTLGDIRTSFSAANFKNLEDTYCNKKGDKDYNYQYRLQKNSNGTEYNIITISPKVIEYAGSDLDTKNSQSKSGKKKKGIKIEERVLNNMKVAKVKNIRYKVTVIIEKSTGYILDVKEESVNDLFEGMTIFGFEFTYKTIENRISFKNEGGVYAPYYVYQDFYFGISNMAKKKQRMGKLDDFFRFTKDLVVMSKDIENTTIDPSKVYNKTTLYEREEATKDKFWLKTNAIVLTKEQQEVIENIE